MDFTQSIDNGYMIPTSVAVGSGEATDIRCVCDTVEDFKTFLDATGMELRYEGLVTYEKVNKLLKVYKGNNVWQTVGEGGVNVDTSSFITLTQLSQQLNDYYTKDQTDEKVAALRGRIEELEGNNTDNGGSIVVKDIFANNELPRIYMTSDRLGLLASKSDPEAMCECEIKINNKTIKCYATGKVQGTTSATFPAKNFTFKFYSDKECSSKQKIDVGWGEQYKYCFKKNWVDTTHTRNLAGARIAYDMVESRPSSDFKSNLQTAPRNGAVDGFPCKLYINGEFWGLYTWNIPKDEWMFNMDSDNPKHMVLCAERNNNGNTDVSYSTQFRKLWDGNDGTEWSIEVGTLSDSLKDSFNNAINFVMTATDEEFKNNISNYFDLYSLLDYYLFSYFACHLDGLGKNMLIGTYDGVHWGAMLYDMDTIFGAFWNGSTFVSSNYRCPSQYEETNSLLWQRIEKCFVSELKERYFELRKGALSLGNVITHVEEIYDLVSDRVFNDDKAKWTGLPSQSTNTITRFRNYMRDRAKYVDECFEELVEPIECTDIKLNSDSLVFTDNTPQKITYTLTPNNATDKVNWEVSPVGICVVDKEGVVRPVSNGQCTITAICGSVSATCSVSVSDMVEISNIVYELEETTKFDGTADTLIDTGVKLYDTDKDWSIIIKYNVSAFTSEWNTLGSCWRENAPIYGTCIKATNKNTAFISYNNNVASGWFNVSNENGYRFVDDFDFVTIIIRKINNKLHIYDSNYKLFKTVEGGVFSAIDRTLVLGGQIDSVTGLGNKYSVSEISNFVIFNSNATESEIKNKASIIFNSNN